MTIRVHELAKEIGIARQELVAAINDLDLDVTVDNYMARLAPSEVYAIRDAMGCPFDAAVERAKIVEPLLGVWERRSTKHRGHDVISTVTHFVVRRDELWRVDPDSVYYVGEVGPERAYSLDWERDVGRITVHYDGCSDQCGLLRIGGRMLIVRWGGVAGKFPASIHDEAGSREVYERVTDSDLVECLVEPPPRRERRALDHPALGRLEYDDNYSGWNGNTTVSGRDGVYLSIEGDAASSAADFDEVAERIHALDAGPVAEYAAKSLLKIYNENWTQAEDDVVDASAFIARLTLESVTLALDDSATVYFDDGGLFHGHVVVVQLDPDGKPVRASMAG